MNGGGIWRSMPVQIAAGILLAGIIGSILYGIIGRA